MRAGYGTLGYCTCMVALLHLPAMLLSQGCPSQYGMARCMAVAEDSLVYELGEVTTGH